jgi:hypothetical protein
MWAALVVSQAALTVTEIKADPATLHTVGIQVLIAGDDNYTRRSRRAGTTPMSRSIASVPRS